MNVIPNTRNLNSSSLNSSSNTKISNIRDKYPKKSQIAKPQTQIKIRDYELNKKSQKNKTKSNLVVLQTFGINQRRRNTNEIRRCISIKNNKCIRRCDRLSKFDLCGIHRKRKLIYLPDGSIWKNSCKSEKISECSKIRPAIRFWELLNSGLSLERLNGVYRPKKMENLRVEKKNYHLKELKRLNVDISTINEKRYYWFLNLLYYLGNFDYSVKLIQRFCKKKIKERLKKKKNAIKTIIRYYRKYKIRKKLPIFIRNTQIFNRIKCYNINDPVTQESYLDVNPERWVVCEYSDSKTEHRWWFDISSAVQLLGNDRTGIGKNPFNRREYPSEFLFLVDEKLLLLKNKYEDLENLMMSEKEIKKNKNELLFPCYKYKYYKIQINSNKLFESLKEFGFNLPRSIFIKYDLHQIRNLAKNLYYTWKDYKNIEQFFPPDGKIFNKSIRNIEKSSDVPFLKNEILTSLLKCITHQENYINRQHAFYRTVPIFRNINAETNQYIEINNLFYM